jgi:hypothetical protein
MRDEGMGERLEIKASVEVVRQKQHDDLFNIAAVH